jgi:hypothetical protein
VTPAALDAIRRRSQQATPPPWMLQDSCSWRRIGTSQGRDGDVLCPTKHPRDGWPDLIVSPENMALIVNAPADIAALLAEVERLRALCRRAGVDPDAGG